MHGQEATLCSCMQCMYNDFRQRQRSSYLKFGAHSRSSDQASKTINRSKLFSNYANPAGSTYSHIDPFP
jgi:hypothetical protein